jgi:hypothetical protein
VDEKYCIIVLRGEHGRGADENIKRKEITGRLIILHNEELQIFSGHMMRL